MSQPGEPYDPNGGYQPVVPLPYPPSQPGAYPPPQPGGYPQYPQGYPGYPPPQGYHPGYQGYPGYPGYPPGYPGYPPPPYGAGRPGNVTAANVLAYITAGLLIAAGLLLFLGASIVDGLDDFDNHSHSLVTAELILDAMLDLLAAGLLIAGAVSFGNRNANGRILLSVGAGIVLGEGVYWVVRTTGDALFWAMVFAALVIISLALAWTSAASNWARAGT